MATVSAKVFKHHKKEDGTYNVKICIHHQNKRKYIDTVHYVVKKQFTPKLKIKDIFIAELLEKQMFEYRKIISELGDLLDQFSVESLKNYLLEREAQKKEAEKVIQINFIQFCKDHIAQLRSEGRSGTADNHRSIRNSLIDYFKRETVLIEEINSNMLFAYAKYLRTKRKMVRINQLGKLVTTIQKPMTENGVQSHMKDLRTLFNEARKTYNNEDLGVIRIKHYPFAKYKVGSAPATRKRNTTVEVFRAIRDCRTPAGSRAELAKDLFVLSFYLCGINAADLFQISQRNIRKGRLEYNRSKTRARRKDNAFISIKIIDEAKPLLEKYIEKLAVRYSTLGTLSNALSIGMKQLCEILGLKGITMYWARHTFASLARNVCRMSIDDIALALNHVDLGNRTTDIYIEKDWRIVDEVQINVVFLIRSIDLKLGWITKDQSKHQNVA